MIDSSPISQTEHEMNLKIIRFLLTRPAELNLPQLAPHLQHQNPGTESKLKTLIQAREVTDCATMRSASKTLDLGRNNALFSPTFHEIEPTRKPQKWILRSSNGLEGGLW